MDNSEERMKILQIVGEIDGGGVASVVLNYLKYGKIILYRSIFKRI